MHNSKQTQSAALKKLLPSDWCKTLSERTGKAWITVNKVVSELKTENEIWPEVMKLANEHQAQIKKNKDELNRLIESA
jgi:hypothetical protein